MIIGIVVVLAAAAIAGAYFLGKRGGEEATTTPTATQTTQTVFLTIPTVTQTATVPPGTPVEILEQSINPSTVSRSVPIAISVRTRGDVTGVRMEITGPQDSSVELNRGPTINGVTSWAAPSSSPGVVGLYRYSAKASAGDGSTVEAPVSTFTVVP